MRCTRPINDGSGRRVPCGRCISCRINKGQEWKDRLLHELESWPNATFLTLTYDPEFLPVDGSLNKSQLQLFFKRFRKSKDKLGERIRYYAVGEYGDQTKRPHYHAIVFGGKYEDKVSDSWGMGLVHCGSVTEQSIAYVTDYVTKKLYGPKAKEEYGGRLPPFALMSKGMGKEWMYSNVDFLVKNGGLRKNGRVYSMPRYYMRKLEDIFDDNYKNSLVLQKSLERLEREAELGLSPKDILTKDVAERRQIEADQAFWESVKLSKL